MKGIRAIISKWTFLVVVSGSCLIGCNSAKVLSPADYLKWMNNPSNGMVKEKEINGLMYEIRYLTPEAMALNELRKTDVSSNEFESVKRQYGKMNYFRLRIYDKNGGHIYNHLKKMRLDPDEVEAYYNYEAYRDWISINDNNDTTKCALFTFAKTYGASVEFDFELAFALIDTTKKENLTIECDDRALNNGTLKFLFSRTDLQKIPQIKI